ncbi:MAG TPA: 30S ribosomal protein S7, partial [Gemmatimonadaceae bacterium]|nr:30S ribosomal protein S7 [Gemmatimonadaceae bacterium]
ERRTALGMRWLIAFARERNEKSMSEKLAAEIIAASKGEGNAIKKKEDTHRMAEANKAFAHYRW